MSFIDRSFIDISFIDILFINVAQCLALFCSGPLNLNHIEEKKGIYLDIVNSDMRSTGFYARTGTNFFSYFEVNIENSKLK